MVKNTFNLINNFWTDFEVAKKTISHVGGFDGFCQCESEKVIEKMSNATEARSFLIIGILIDQSVNGLNSGFNKENYEEFRSVFTYPKLVAHFDGSECSSAWFCYPSHGYDKKVNWLNLEQIGKIIFPETKQWILDNYDLYMYESVRSSILENVNSSFRPEQEGFKLIKVIENFF